MFHNSVLFENDPWKNAFSSVLIFLHCLRIRTYEHEDQWDKAVGSYDLEMAQPIAATQVGLLQVNMSILH